MHKNKQKCIGIQDIGTYKETDFFINRNSFTFNKLGM